MVLSTCSVIFLDSSSCYIAIEFTTLWTSLVAQMVKNLPVMQEIQVRSLGQKDPLEEGMANHSSILGWRIPWKGEPGGLQSIGLQGVGRD